MSVRRPARDPWGRKLSLASLESRRWWVGRWWVGGWVLVGPPVGGWVAVGGDDSITTDEPDR